MSTDFLMFLLALTGAVLATNGVLCGLNISRLRRRVSALELDVTRLRGSKPLELGRPAPVVEGTHGQPAYSVCFECGGLSIDHDVHCSMHPKKRETV